MTLRLGASSLMRSKGYLGADLRQRSRLGASKAITAAAHKRARIVCNLLRSGVKYAKKTEAESAEQTRERAEKNLQRRARELGCELKRIEPKLETVVMLDEEVLSATSDGVIYP